MAEQTRVQLPEGVGRELEVFVNGVPQQEGKDFRRVGDELVFGRRLAEEGRLGFWRWTSLFLGVAGTYRQNDSVDVVYERTAGAWSRAGSSCSPRLLEPDPSIRVTPSAGHQPGVRMVLHKLQRGPCERNLPQRADFLFGDPLRALLRRRRLPLAPSTGRE